MVNLSIIVPVYNEEKTIEQVVDKLQRVDFGDISHEIVIVNDSSTDNSLMLLEKLAKKYRNIRLVTHTKNMGKGAAIRTALRYISGDIVVIQDGDLEYNPEDFKKLIKPILEGKTKVVYGSRLLGQISGFNIPSHYYGNKLLSFITGFLYGKKITDMETCYKMMKREVMLGLNLKSSTFDIEPEITAKLLKKKYKIIEIPISYHCRSFEEGKKITWEDGILAIYTLFKYRFLS